MSTEKPRLFEYRSQRALAAIGAVLVVAFLFMTGGTLAGSAAHIAVGVGGVALIAWGALLRPRS